MSSQARQAAAQAPAKVLLIDGDAHNAMATELMLKDLGVATVRATCSVAVAIALIASNDVDLVILDLDSSYPNLMAVMERLLVDAVPAIFSSASIRQLPDMRGAARFLRKPHSEEDLSRLLY
jgi:CheY-like chemotaxis protein